MMNRKTIETFPYDGVTEQVARELVHVYSTEKQLPVRYKILRLLCTHDYAFLQPFFLAATKRERWLDMKILGIKGLAQFASEAEIAKIMAGFRETLAKREKSTPHDYQEYEPLLGPHALPYLVEKYGYEAFRATLAQTKAQYDRMPDAFKGHLTTDIHGEIVPLEVSAEKEKAFRKFSTGDVGI